MLQWNYKNFIVVQFVFIISKKRKRKIIRSLKDLWSDKVNYYKEHVFKVDVKNIFKLKQILSIIIVNTIKRYQFYY